MGCLLTHALTLAICPIPSSTLGDTLVPRPGRKGPAPHQMDRSSGNSDILELTQVREKPTGCSEKSGPLGVTVVTQESLMERTLRHLGHITPGQGKLLPGGSLLPQDSCPWLPIQLELGR